MRATKVLKIVAIGVVAITVVGFVVMDLWNWLIPALFGLRTLDFWQALGLLILSKILFGGFRGRPGYGGPWRRRVTERWQEMTPEEREHFRSSMRHRCQPKAGPGESPEARPA